MLVLDLLEGDFIVKIEDLENGYAIDLMTATGYRLPVVVVDARLDDGLIDPGDEVLCRGPYDEEVRLLVDDDGVVRRVLCV